MWHLLDPPLPPDIKSYGLLTPPAGKRIVTSYEVLAQEYFREVDERAGLAPDEGTRIEYISGSVEAACALGLADGIGTIPSLPTSRTHTFDRLMSRARVVDLVESGETMRAAGLHPLSTLLQTSAVLIRSTTPKHPSLEPLVAKIASRIAGFVASNKYVVCQVRPRPRHFSPPCIFLVFDVHGLLMITAVQRPPRPAPEMPANHPRPTGSDNQPDRGQRLVCCQCDGREEEERGCDGRACRSRCRGCLPCGTS